MEPQWPQRALDLNSEDFYQAEQALALISVPATPQKMKNCTPVTIAAAVSDCVDKKIAVSVLAAKYKVHPSTIRKWVSRAGKTLPSREGTTPKKEGNPSILNYFSPTRVSA